MTTCVPEVPQQADERTRSASRRRSRGKRVWIARCLLLVCSTLIAVELVCQLYTSYLGSNWAEVRKRNDHFYLPSDDSILAYELVTNRVATKDGRMLSINSHGIRDADDELHTGKRKIALLGDSVTFGTGHSQEDTISEMLQEKLDGSRASVKVLNFGVPGYGLDELAELLRNKNAVYSVNHVVFILNANDFCRRDTVYEGADNGLYRMYRRPWITTPWVIRKLIYRYHKGGALKKPNPVSVGWYRWMFAGNREHGFGKIREMREYCKENGIGFTLVLLPAGCAYVDGQYELNDMYRDIADFARHERINPVNCTGEFGKEPAKLFDSTDHLQQLGNELMATIIAQSLESTTQSLSIGNGTSGRALPDVNR